MTRRHLTLGVLALGLALSAGPAGATTREIAGFEQARLTFDTSILNELTYGSYRDPFDELQTRPYNLLFMNIGRYSTLVPWQGQEEGATRYFNALIGNNGTANVDNDADSIQGALIRRETAGWAWGVSGAFLSGTRSNDDTAGTVSFSDDDELAGFDVRLASALQLSERRVFGIGLRATTGTHELSERSLESGVGGALSVNDFSELHAAFDAGMRTFLSEASSWEWLVVFGYGSAEQDEYSDALDDTGQPTDRFVSGYYDLSELRVALEVGYNRLKLERIGETEYRVEIEHVRRELDNSDISFTQDSGGVTPVITLLDQDPVAMTNVRFSVRSLFQAGETEMFTGATLGYGMRDGSTRIDAAGITVNESIDDTALSLGLTVGLRQPLLRDRLRFIVSGHADFASLESETAFDTGRDANDATLSTSRYAIGLEGVLSNVVFDIAWLRGEEAPVEPVDVGLPSGSRRAVELYRLIFSAAVSW